MSTPDSSISVSGVWKVEIAEGARLDVSEVASVYRASGLDARRPVTDVGRFTTMIRQANLIVTARLDDRLIGIARSLTDWSYVTYLCDLAVDRDMQRRGVGKSLVEATRQAAPHAKVVLLSAPAATDYYPHIGFTRHDSAWVMNPLA